MKDKRRHNKGCHIHPNADKYYYMDGLNHRIWGPATIYKLEKYWILFGKEYSENEYWEIMGNLPLFYWKHWNKLWK